MKERIREWLRKNVKIYRGLQKIREHLGLYTAGLLIGLYLYGIVIHSFLGAAANFNHGTNHEVFSLNPIKCYAAVFTPQGFGVAFFLFIMYFLITQKWIHLITGVRITKDERNFYVSNEGTHGTSGWMDKKEKEQVLRLGSADALPCPILGKLKDGPLEDDKYADYIGLRDDIGLNQHTMVYGASGAGKSRGFVKPFILKTAALQQSMVIVDPKAEFFEQMAEYLRKQGYVVKAFNLLDMENSDGWNCIGEIGNDIDMVQSVAEVIIRNTSEDGQKADFWDSVTRLQAVKSLRTGNGFSLFGELVV